jgi:hypothetical protein
MVRLFCGLIALMMCVALGPMALAQEPEKQGTEKQGIESKRPKHTEKWPHALVMVIYGGTKDAGASVTAAKVGRFITRTKCQQAIAEVGAPSYSIGELRDWLQVAYLCVPESTP